MLFMLSLIKKFNQIYVVYIVNLIDIKQPPIEASLQIVKICYN
ncbi:hypothetical protein BegalDRAFT_1810 [Beggiatoa alba B18LD]|uniref:Uncharacterized protein n=1 Tax=Beggiatoa alba B18LD TaxID=395493 RepID=I3CGE1_9GAMM|nr:hypothetical protein BegalDRAFT_1810 [Beggiatoa alba B18LD]